MAELFEESSISSMTLPNRFVRSATWEGLADMSGRVTPGLIDRQTELARGGVGLIITGHTYVSDEGKAGSWQLGVYGDDLIPGLAKMTEAVHREGAKIVMQLAHAGCRGAVHLTGKMPIGPSEIRQDNKTSCREMQGPDFEVLLRAFAEGSRRAREAGFDGVQVHAAHGYLLSQFLCPAFNQRSDRYGGDIFNRARLLLEVCQAIRETVGSDFPVMVKINSEDFLEKGMTVDEMLRVAEMLEKAGIDAVELSGGTFYSAPYLPSRTTRITSEADEVYYRDAAVRFKGAVRTPLVLVGGIRSYPVAEKLVQEGTADYVALCRPLISEPDLVRRWRLGDRRPSDCISDNGCFKPAFKGKGISCVTKQRRAKKAD